MAIGMWFGPQTTTFAPSFGQGHHEVRRPCHPMGMDDDGNDIVQSDATCFLAPGRDHEEASIDRKVQAVGRDIDDPFHSFGLSCRESWIQHAPRLVDPHLAAFPLLQEMRRLVDVFERVQVIA